MGKSFRVLMVEDSADDAELILHELRQRNYEPVAERVETAKEMVAALEKQPWDIVLSDYQMPHFDGIKALKLLQSKGMDIPRDTGDRLAPIPTVPPPIQLPSQLDRCESPPTSTPPSHPLTYVDQYVSVPRYSTFEFSSANATTR